MIDSLRGEMMSLKLKYKVLVVSALSLAIVAVKFVRDMPRKIQHVPAVFIVSNEIENKYKKESQIQKSMWEVAKIFGRSAGCKDASPELGRLVAESAVNHNIQPRILASVVSIESGCNPFATSSRGAIGLGQVMPSVWKGSFDFQGKVNLLNEKDNLETTATILASYIKDYGDQGGVLHYQGTAKNCPSCDDDYTGKVVRLAEGK
jgi:soluble lytic murein transglycosylase-like protein